MAIDPKRQLGGEPLTASEEFFDAMVRHQIGLLRVSGSIANDVNALLDATESDIRRQINEASRSGIGFDSPAKVSRLNALLASLTAIRLEAWKQATQTWVESMRDLAVREPAFIDSILKTTMPVDLSTSLPNSRRLRAIVTSQPFQGKVLREWAKDMRRADIDRIQSQIKIGLTQGESGRAIARRVVGRISTRGRDGVLQITRKKAQLLTRTATNAIANHARRQYHEENKDLIDKELYVATLDSRTTIQCASLDGQRFEVGQGPIPPVHFACRSLRVALVDPDPIGRRPFNPTTERRLLREFSSQRGISTRIRSRADLPRGTKASFDEFARRRKRELIGRVPSKVSYTDFLRRQSSEFQDEYLGATRAKLFRGGFPLTRIVDPAGKPIPLSQLSRTHASAFRAAGLDPVGFQ